MTDSWKLRSVISHIGPDFTDGHWIADVHINNSWFICDNDKVEKTTEEFVLKKRQDSACMLFYVSK